MWHKLFLEEILPQKYEASLFIFDQASPILSKKFQEFVEYFFYLFYQHLLQLYNQFHSPTKSFKQSLGPHPPMQTTIYRSHDSNW